MNKLFAPHPAEQSEPRRLLWIVNHRTLLPAEVPLLRSLGWEVFVPKVVPDHDPGYRSAVVSWEYDTALQLPGTALQILNRHNFYERTWSATVESIVNAYFSVVITSFTYYVTPISEAVRKFPGHLIVRPFGREDPRTYTEFLSLGRRYPGAPIENFADGRRERLLAEIEAMGERFIFGQGYDNIAEVEAPELQRRAHTITLPLPEIAFQYRDTWRGGGRNAVFLCPAINSGIYYRAIYDGIKRDFGDLPHVIFGRQNTVVDDPAVLPYLTDPELFALYAEAPVFVYPHTEPRHIHYSPLEAMLVGTPTLYLRGALTDVLVGGVDLPGACRDLAEMHNKTRHLLEGDRDLAEAIRGTQGQVLNTFSEDLAQRQWQAVLPGNAPAGRAA